MQNNVIQADENDFGKVAADVLQCETLHFDSVCRQLERFALSLHHERVEFVIRLEEAILDDETGLVAESHCQRDRKVGKGKLTIEFVILRKAIRGRNDIYLS